MKNTFQKISEKWFLSEPLLFSILCTHQLIEKQNLHVRFRTGKKKIEYNSERLIDYSFREIEEYLKIEIIRILLKHPYQRQSFMERKDAMAVASDITISENYIPMVKMHKTTDFNLSPNGYFEMYYRELAILFANYFSMMHNKKPKNDDVLINDGGGNQLDIDDNSTTNETSTNTKEEDLSKMNSVNQDDNLSFPTMINEIEENEKAELWEQDELINESINQLIETAERNKKWGSLSGKIVDQIIASKKIEINYQSILRQFKTSIITNQRKLTRFKPSRRYGFEYMGSKYEFSSQLLVAIDVSGSVTNTTISNFLSIINHFFKYGIKNIDVIQFDTEIKGKLCSLKKAKNVIKVYGRGGTNFQPVFDFIEKQTKYDGLIIFTDGYAPIPQIKNKKINYLWVLEDVESYRSHKEWICKLPKTKLTWIPIKTLQ